MEVTKMEIMELENAKQNLPHGLNSRVEMTENKINKFEDWSIEFTISDEQKQKGLRTKLSESQMPEGQNKNPTFFSSEFPNEKRMQRKNC